jgi:uncharacterized membrane protein YjgN (DUF898 family)
LGIHAAGRGSFGAIGGSGLLLGSKSKLLVGSLSVFGLLTLPFFHALFRRYMQRNLRFGSTKFAFNASPKDFAAVWAWGICAMLIIALGVAAVAVMLIGLGIVILNKGVFANLGISIGIFASAWLAYFLIGSYFAARFQRLVWEKTSVGAVGLHCDISASTLIILQVKNTVLVVVTLGLYRPYAAVALARYRLGTMTVTASDQLNSFLNGATQSARGASGESADELFNMDVGL